MLHGCATSGTARLGQHLGLPPLIKSAVLFDVYRPAVGNADFAPGERSLAVRVELLDEVAPLTEERIEAVIAQAVTRVSLAHQARLRA